MLLAEWIFFLSNSVMFSTFTSQSFNVGNDITSWNVFSVNETLGGAAIKYTLFASTQANINLNNPATYQSSQVVTNNSIPSIATASFVLVSASFSRTQGSQEPSILDFTIKWNEGLNLRAKSLFSDHRYFLSVSISSTANNTVMVLDRNKEWQKHTGINANAMTLYNSNPMFGNTGGIFQMEEGYDDNGSTIASKYKTKDFFPSGFNFFTRFNSLYMVTANAEETLETDYYVDGVNSALGLADYSMDTNSGYQIFKLPFASTSFQQGKSIAFEWSVNGGSFWNLLSGSLAFASEPLPIP